MMKSGIHVINVNILLNALDIWKHTKRVNMKVSDIHVIIVIIMIQKSGHYIVPVMVKNLVKYVFFRIYLFLFN